jgi:hypothetical protein
MNPSTPVTPTRQPLLLAWVGAGATMLAALAWPGAASAAEASKEGVEFFEKNVRPVLVDNCYKCHSSEAKANKKLKGKFYADSLEGLTKGGDSGEPGVVPGETGKGTVLKSIRYEYKGDDESLNMPPKNKKDGTGGKLPDDVVKKIEAWVKMGAPVPKDFEKPKDEKKADAGPGAAPGAGGSAAAVAHEDPKAHWAFTQPKLSPVPAVKDVSGWARTDVDRFVLAKLEARGLKPADRADKRALVRRVTFDLIGLPPTPEDVEAFVADASPDAYAKLVDRLLSDPRYGERWARHWLDVARYADTKGYVFQEERRYPYAYTYRDYVIRAFNEDKPYDRFLVEQIAADQLDLGTDKKPLAAMGFMTLGRRFLNNIHDIIDDRIDVICRGTMGLTVACARCHDHKFDPIPTKDYYALHGIFASSTEPKDLPLIGEAKGSDAYEAELAKRQAAVDEYVAKTGGEILAQVRTAKGLADYLMATADPAKQGGEATADLSRAMVQRFRTSMQQSAQKKDPVFAAWRMYAAGKGDGFEAKAKQVTEQLAKAEASAKGDAAAEERTKAKGPAVAVNSLVRKAFAGGQPSPTSLAQVAERYGELLAKFDKPDPLPNADEEALRLVLRGPESPLSMATADLPNLFKRDTRDKLRQLQNKIAEFQATSPEAPPRAMVMADAPNPHNSQVLLRGNPGNPGPPAVRQFLEVASGPDRKPFTNGSGRLEFAQAIASRTNPLTARVFVNRVWAWHFGRGIVATPSDFGVRCDPPTHPELLDFLAVSFMDDGWSIKKLHRRLLLSATYQQGTAEGGHDDNAPAKAADPENLLLWRQNRRRADFEVMRDSLLAVSGQLDAKVYGRPVDIARAEENRRTIYGFIDRQNLPSMFRSFDFAGPDMHAPQRSATTVPQQALFFLNSPFAQRQAKLLLERPDVKGKPDTAAKVTRIYELLYGRAPSADEVELAKAFLASEASTAAEPTSVAAGPTWSYGYGKVDEASNKVVGFAPLPFFGKRGWRGGAAIPDPKLGFVMLSDKGGHPGDKDHAAVRRWTAPMAGTVAITGTLEHAPDTGDGVRGRVVLGRGKVLAEGTARHGKAAMAVAGVEVKAGETIDFVVESGPTVTSDSFTWVPIVVLSSPALAGGSQRFDAAADYSGTAGTPAPAAKLTAWEKYAQVLLSSNEFVFVD